MNDSILPQDEWPTIEQARVILQRQMEEDSKKSLEQIMAEWEAAANRSKGSFKWNW